MAIVDTIEYSVCQDCTLFVAYGTVDEDGTEGICETAMEHEQDGRKGHWVNGIEATEDDPDGTGDEEFSRQDCELCRSGLAGSRHGVTLILEDDN